MTSSQDISFEEKGALAVVTLRRPKALNALTLAMIEAFDQRLRAWAANPSVRAVLVKGEGERAFCAGGDVRAIYEAGKRGDPLTADFFHGEYSLNRRIHVFPKPYIALIDGITMGGGVGISVHGSHRVATENTMFAMPETGIGLFPDVGMTYVLPRLPGEIGLYLGLTGQRLKAPDCLYTGIATHFMQSSRLRELEATLASVDFSDAPVAVVGRVLAELSSEAGVPTLAEQRAAIDRCFAKESVEAVLEALAGEDTEWATATLEHLKTRSPTSLKVTFRAVREGRALSFDRCMIVEYRLSQACMAGHDFYEGVRAVVLDKDNRPNWRPASLEAVTGAVVERHFEPLGERDLRFEYRC